jgi:biotin operon repressor
MTDKRNIGAMIRELLREHAPYHLPMKSKAIEARLIVSGISVRKAVAELRLEGYPIGSDNRGYYYCDEPEQLDATVIHLHGRIRAEEQVLDAVKGTIHRMINERSEHDEADQ